MPFHLFSKKIFIEFLVHLKFTKRLGRVGLNIVFWVFLKIQSNFKLNFSMNSFDIFSTLFGLVPKCETIKTLSHTHIFIRAVCVCVCVCIYIYIYIYICVCVYNI